MKQNILVSICCITHNHEKYIRNAIEGFLIQETEFPIEIIIHDDASSDRTPEIIREYKNKNHSLFRIILQDENQWSKGEGSIYSRFVFPKARGKYIALCEGDDYWTDPLKLQKQIDFLESNLDYSVSSHEIEFKYDGVKPEKYQYGNPIVDADFEQILMSDLFIAFNSMVFRTQFVNPNPSWFDKAGGHKALIYYLASKGKNHHFMDAMGVKRRNPGGVTIKNKEERKRTKLKRQIFLLNNLKTTVEEGKKTLIEKKIKALYLQHSKKAIKRGKLIKGGNYLLKYLI